MNIGVVDCGGANLNSIKYALKRINVDAEVSSNIDVLKTKDAFILPGVGSAGVVMSYLTDKKLDEFICNTNKLTLGICITSPSISLILEKVFLPSIKKE